MFSSQFMIYALIGIIFVTLLLPLIGINVVTKRMSMIGDVISHTSLCGIAIGLVAGSLPILWAILASVIAGIIIEFVRTKFSKFAEISLAIVMSFAIGLTSILSTNTGNRLESFLFGSILTLDNLDLIVLAIVFAVCAIFFVGFYRTNMFIAYNPQEAVVSKLPIKAIGYLSSVVISASIAVSSAIIGSLLVASLMIIPVACAIQITKSYFKTIIVALVISFLSGFLGLVISYYANIHTGGTIVLIATSVLIITFIVKYGIRVYFKFRKNK